MLPRNLKACPFADFCMTERLTLENYLIIVQHKKKPEKNKNYNNSRISTSVRIALTEDYLTHFLIQQAFSAINESTNWIILSFQNLFYCLCFRWSYRLHHTCIVYTEHCILCNYTASEAIDTAVLQADSNVLINSQSSAGNRVYLPFFFFDEVLTPFLSPGEAGQGEGVKSVLVFVLWEKSYGLLTLGSLFFFKQQRIVLYGWIVHKYVKKTKKKPLMLF